MTELEAVNEMLATLGEAPVDDLESGLYEAELARVKLRQVAREVQTSGWTFNSDYNYPLAPNAQGFIEIPATAISVDTSKSGMDVTQRGGMLYDRKTRSHVFTQTLECGVIWNLTFDDLPAPAQHYICIKASRAFQKQRLGSQTIDAFTKEDEMDALTKLETFDAGDGRFNMVKNNPWSARLYQGRK